MAPKPLPSQEVLHKLLDYSPVSGRLTWLWRNLNDFSDLPGRSANHRCNHWNAKFAGREAFTADNGRGYLIGRIDGRSYLAHRIVWKWCFGEDPEQIDHINGDRADNSLSNLRAVTSQQNLQNKSRYVSNVSGVVGISKVRSGLWVARISANAVEYHLGTFTCLGQAIRARKAAEKQHKFHPNHGRAA